MAVPYSPTTVPSGARTPTPLAPAVAGVRAGLLAGGAGLPLLSDSGGRRRPAQPCSTWRDGPIGCATLPTKPEAGPSVQASMSSVPG